ncbi:MAG: hypothetical protein M1836_003057 [Candelina mexicana]|nr:MAG: hypothetical protein M1836_003057 [Candelina mexicana]
MGASPSDFVRPGSGDSGIPASQLSDDTILHLSITSSLSMLSLLLLSHSPRLNTVNTTGYTPLSRCVYLTLAEPAILLLEAGAAVHVSDVKRTLKFFPGRLVSSHNEVQITGCMRLSGVVLEWFRERGRLNELRGNLRGLERFMEKEGTWELWRLYRDAGAEVEMDDGVEGGEDGMESCGFGEGGEVWKGRETYRSADGDGEDVFFDACDANVVGDRVDVDRVK